MKKIIKKIVSIIALTMLSAMLYTSVSTSIALANQTQFTGPITDIQKIGEKTQLENFDATGQHPDAPSDYITPGVGTVSSPVLFAIDLFRYAISGIAMLVIVIQSIKLVSTASEEEATQAKTTLIMGVIGLLVIQMANVLVKNVFFGEQGEAFQDIANAQIYGEEGLVQIRGIIGFVEAFLGIASVLVLVIRGFTLITSTGEEEEMAKAKTHVLYAIVGLAIVALSEVLVRGIVFPEAGQVLPDAERGKFVIVELTNFIAGFISLLAFVALFYAGYKYVASAGNEEETEKVKKVFVSAVIAIVLSMGAFALINTLVRFEPLPAGDAAQDELTQSEVVGEGTN